MTSTGCVKVRMYNVGFGDCFLLIFPGPQGDQKVLIDCGTIALASISMKDIVQEIIDDVKDANGVPIIDLIVCTHRHADHVSGFADARWKDVVVREVWMPWTENPKDPEAKRIRETQSRLALALESAWKSKLAAGDSSASGFLDIALNALSNTSAMQTLHNGFSGRAERRFLSAQQRQVIAPLKPTVLHAVTTYVLGPFKSEDIIRDMEPPAGKTYLKQTQAQGGLAGFEPFGPEWGMPASRYSWGELVVSQSDKAQLKALSDLADPAITVSLDKAVNGTSLVLVFEIGGAVLLFPGDAQWGTWNAILQDAEATELLSRATFLKVGHHGSHNATPREFVSKVLRNNCCAMMSTKSGKWASIPRLPLLEALQERTRLARSDEVLPQLQRPFTLSSPSFTEAEIPL